MIYHMLKQEQGYTLVETLVALAILVAVLFPLSHLMARLLVSEQSRDLIVGMQLARQGIEIVTTAHDYFSTDRSVRTNNKTYLINRSIQRQHRLITIQVDVYRKGRSEPVVTLKTMRLDDDT